LIGHILEVTARPGRAEDVCRVIQESLPIWRAQPGFVEQILLADPRTNHVIAQTFWRSQEDADRFDRNALGRMTATLQDFMAAPAKTATYQVAASTDRTLFLRDGDASLDIAGHVQVGATAAQAMKAPAALFVLGLEFALELSRGAQSVYNDMIDGTLGPGATPSAAGPATGTDAPGWRRCDPGRGRCDMPADPTRETLSGLIAFVVPGPDPYSVAQGMSTPEPGGLDAGILEPLIASLNQSQPSPPGQPPAAASIAEALNGIAQRVNPQASGPFSSPFARLSFAEKMRVFQAIEGDAETQALAALLPLTAFLVYSEAAVFDRDRHILRGWPLGWRLSGYEGVADGRADFKGYHEDRRRVETSERWRGARAVSTA
jgi:hypothetical protein